jgi:hypothetical protein
VQRIQQVIIEKMKTKLAATNPDEDEPGLVLVICLQRDAFSDVQQCGRSPERFRSR